MPGTTAFTSRELEAGAAQVERLVSAMGGAEAIGSVQAVSVAGTMTRPLPTGARASAQVRTFVRFPSLYRQELRMPAGTVTTIIGPAGAWILAGAETPLPLPETRRLEIENIILRNPVALLKTRGSELFTAVAAEGKLQIRVGSKLSTITLDSRGLIETMTYDLPASGGNLPSRVTVTYSDYRRAGPIQYPFASRAEASGAVTYQIQLDTVTINETLPDSFFVPKGDKQN